MKRAMPVGSADSKGQRDATLVDQQTADLVKDEIFRYWQEQTLAKSRPKSAGARPLAGYACVSPFPGLTSSHAAGMVCATLRSGVRIHG